MRLFEKLGTRVAPKDLETLKHQLDALRGDLDGMKSAVESLDSLVRSLQNSKEADSLAVNQAVKSVRSMLQRALKAERAAMDAEEEEPEISALPNADTHPVIDEDDRARVYEQARQRFPGVTIL